MKTFTTLLALAAMSLSSAPGLAVDNSRGPFLNGKYAFIQTEMCEAKLLVENTEGGVSSVTLDKPGMMASSTGYITFVPTGPTEGMATITGSSLIEGGALRVNNYGFNWIQHASDAPARKYTFTTTTFVLAGDSYRMTIADIVNGIPKTVYLLRREDLSGNPNCLISISATRQ